MPGVTPKLLIGNRVHFGKMNRIGCDNRIIIEAMSSLLLMFIFLIEIMDLRIFIHQFLDRKLLVKAQLS